MLKHQTDDVEVLEIAVAQVFVHSFIFMPLFLQGGSRRQQGQD